jgi:hypothetical protein
MKIRWVGACVIGCVVYWLRFTPEAWSQARSLYQQTQFKGMEIGKLTGDNPTTLEWTTTSPRSW